MIGRLRGEYLGFEGGVALIEAAGVGYEVLVPASLVPGLPPPGEETLLHIRQVVREDAITLYGFASAAQRRLFDLLIEVKGCGPKTALALLGEVGEESVTAAIMGGDARSLSRATGVGARLAERILLELKDRIHTEVLLARANASRAVVHERADELVEALMALGYRRAESETAAASARQEAEGVEEQLRLALRGLRP